MVQKPLSEVADVVRGIAFPKEDKSYVQRSGDVACLRTTNVQKQVEWDDLWFVPAKHVKRDDQNVRTGDILISTANSYELVGKVAQVAGLPTPATLGAFISLIRPKDGVHPKFLYHQLAWGQTQTRIREMSSNTTNISNVSTKKLATLELAMPDFDQQTLVVAELEKQFSRLDKAVANLQRVKANLKRYKASVLKDAVEGRLVPTEAELARRDGRSFETGEQLLQRILEARRSAWKGKGKFVMPDGPSVTNLAALPEGWTWASAIQACEHVVDCHNKTAPYTTSGIPLVRTTNIRDGRLLLDEVRCVDQPTYEFWSRRCPPEPGDVLFTREAPMGEAGIVPPGVTLCLGQRTMLMRPSPAISAGFLLSALLSPVVKDLIDRVAVGSGVKHLRVGDVERLPVPLPPIAEQLRVVAEVERRLSLIRQAETQAELNLLRAERLRSSLLSKAFATTSKYS
nr:restriction endonuclease subunit S [Rhodoferax sp.]